MRQHQPVSRPARSQASSAMDVLAPCAPPVPPMPPIPQPPAEFLHGWKRHSMGKPVTDRQLFWEFCFKRNVATATSVAPTRAFGRSGFSCTSKSAGQRNRGQPRTSVAKTRKIVLHSGSVDCNRHSDATESADCGQIFGRVLKRPKGKSRRMDAGMVGQATAGAKCIRSTSRVQCIRAIHSRKPCPKWKVARSWRRTGHAVPALCVSAK